MRKLAPLFATLLLLAAAPLAAAQNPFPAGPLLVEKGHITFIGNLDPSGLFTFEGAGLTLTGGLHEGLVSPSCSPCYGGQQVSIRTVFAGEQSMRAGTLTIGETSRDVFYSGELVFDGNQITLPTRYTRRPFKVTFPITLQGHLQVHWLNPNNTPNGLLFDLPVNLPGTATLTMKLGGINPGTGNPQYFTQSLSYELKSPEKAQDN